MRTRNLILLVLVTAALVIPSGYIVSIELDSHSQKTLPPIYTNGTLYSSSWRGDFNALGTVPYLFNISESTTFHQPGFQTSTLNVSLSHFQIYYFMHKGSFQIALNLNYSSIMHLSSFPLSLLTWTRPCLCLLLIPRFRPLTPSRTGQPMDLLSGGTTWAKQPVRTAVHTGDG